MSEDLLVVGLGNPGAEYAGTRHNLGADCLAEVARRAGHALDRRRWDSLVASYDTGEGQARRRVWMIWPQTYMNMSGRSVRAAVRDLEVSPGSVWVLHDELDLPLCRLRIQLGGSAAGNNGIRSIMGSLGQEGFVRFRIGVGKPPSSTAGAGYVLGRFSRAEKDRVPQIVAGVADAVEAAMTTGVEQAMTVYNRRGSLGCEELA